MSKDCNELLTLNEVLDILTKASDTDRDRERDQKIAKDVEKRLNEGGFILRSRHG